MLKLKDDLSKKQIQLTGNRGIKMAEIKENKRIFKKNDEVEIEIIDLTDKGDGIGKYEGFTIFVKGALIGDVVVAHLIYVQKRYANAIIAIATLAINIAEIKAKLMNSSSDKPSK